MVMEGCTKIYVYEDGSSMDLDYGTLVLGDKCMLKVFFVLKVKSKLQMLTSAFLLKDFILRLVDNKIAIFKRS